MANDVDDVDDTDRYCFGKEQRQEESPRILRIFANQWQVDTQEKER